jgi:hypothetical protein
MQPDWKTTVACGAPGSSDELPAFLISVFFKQMTHANAACCRTSISDISMLDTVHFEEISSFIQLQVLFSI